MRLLYTFAMYLLMPAILYRLAVRGLRAPAYFSRWRERFGFFEPPPQGRSIWIHAVSLGEVNAALPLIEALMTEAFPGRQFVITTVTPTGAERVERVFADRARHIYLPHDLPSSVRRFLDRVDPVLAVVMETEIWPNLLHGCKARAIPIVVANARLSEHSLKGYRLAPGLVASALNCATRIGAQTQTDTERLLRLGADPERITVTGSLKFDMQVPPALRAIGRELRRGWGAERFVLIAASTHEDDEIPLMEAFARLLEQDPDALLILVPRHPERFSRALARCRGLGYRTVQHSEAQAPGPETQCLVIDAMGVLMDYYAAADLAFVGGSLAYIGGHNVLEPAALGLPVLVGPHTFNFSEITQLLLDSGGAKRVGNAEELATEVLRLRHDHALRTRMGTAADTLVKSNRGALRRTLALIHEAAPEA